MLQLNISWSGILLFCWIFVLIYFCPLSHKLDFLIKKSNHKTILDGSIKNQAECILHFTYRCRPKDFRCCSLLKYFSVGWLYFPSDIKGRDSSKSCVIEDLFSLRSSSQFPPLILLVFAFLAGDNSFTLSLLPGKILFGGSGKPVIKNK